MEPAQQPGEPLGRSCQMCGRPLENANDPLSADCGGDCLNCLADCGDPDCIAAIEALKRTDKV